MKKEKEKEYVAQWYWQKDWKNEWQKAFYVGPREERMYLMEEENDDSSDRDH